MKPSPSSRSFEGKISRSRLLEGQIAHIFLSNYLFINHKERQSHTYIHPIDPDALSEVDTRTHTYRSIDTKRGEREG